MITDSRYMPTTAKIAWQHKMRSRGGFAPLSAVALSPAGLRTQTLPIHPIGSVILAAPCNEAGELRGHFEAGVNQHYKGQEHILLATKPVRYKDYNSRAPAAVNSSTGTSHEQKYSDFTFSSPLPGYKNARSSSPDGNGWWDVLKSPFFVDTPTPTSGASSSTANAGSEDIVELATEVPALTQTLPTRLHGAELAPPAAVDSLPNVSLPPFVAVVIEANRLERMRLAALQLAAGTSYTGHVTSPAAVAAEADLGAKSPVDEPVRMVRPSGNHKSSMHRTTSSARAVRPLLNRGAQSMPGRLYRLSDFTTTAQDSARKEIKSTSFLQVVLEMDAQEKQEKKMKVKVKVKVKRRKRLAEEGDDDEEEEVQEDWDFKCRGVDPENEYFAGCIVKEKKARSVKESKPEPDPEPDPTPMPTGGNATIAMAEVRRRPTVKELRSGVKAGHIPKADGTAKLGIARDINHVREVSGGSERRRKLVRRWTSFT